MAPGKKDNPRETKPGNKDIPATRHAQSKEDSRSAHREADKDIAQDPDFAPRTKNDDLDEGETSRLGEDMSGIV